MYWIKREGDNILIGNVGSSETLFHANPENWVLYKVGATVIAQQVKDFQNDKSLLLALVTRVELP